MMELETVPRIRQLVETVKTEVKKRTGLRWLEHDEAVRAHRCQIASDQALRDLEAVKSGARAGSNRTGYFR
ncbi:MAG: hypothetical protein ACFFF4_05860 [Candidatus Thorarchaeota archaeon]